MKRGKKSKSSGSASAAHSPARGGAGGPPAPREGTGKTPVASPNRGPGDCSQVTAERASAVALAPPSRGLTIAAAALIVLCAVAAYRTSFVGVFVYDDAPAIVENPTIRQLWPIGPVLSPPRDGETVTGRPLLNLSLAINYAISGLKVWSYHATNLAIHIAAALLLFGILRRTFLMPMLRDRFGRAATALALGSALLWTVHPVQTESVTYIVQRAESLAGLFYLLTLYCVIRGAGDRSAGLWPAQADAGETPALRGQIEKGDCPPFSAWYGAAVLACLLGTACKEILVTAPLVVLLYDRTFLAGSFTEAWRRRWGLYVGLAASWALLVYLVFSTGLIFRQSQMDAPDVWSYARSQPGVILHYLKMSVWPSSLCFDCDWPVAITLGEILPGAITVGLLLAATVWGLLGRKAWGFLGAWFFLILAPTSSILPLHDLAYVHRMYLSLAAIAVLVVAATYAFWERLVPLAGQAGQSPFPPGRTQAKTGLWTAKKGTVPNVVAVTRWAAPAVALAAVVVALGCATAARNWDYRSLLVLWQDAVDKRPSNAIAQNNLGFALVETVKSPEAIEEAIGHYREALRLKPAYPGAHNNLGTALALLGKDDEAIEHFLEALRLQPDFAVAYCNLGWSLAHLGRTGEAIQRYQAALRIRPNYADAHYNLGVALVAAGRVDQAIQHYQRALQLKPDYVSVHNDLGAALASLGKTDQAIEHFQEALHLQADCAEAHNNLAMVLAYLNRTDEAVQHYRQALQLKPDFADAHYNLGKLLLGVGKTNEAIEHCRQAVRLKPGYAVAHNELGAALLQTRNAEEAIRQYREALRLKPDYAEAQYNLGLALATVGKFDEASEHYREALRLKPDDAPAHNNLGNVLAALGRADEALEQYRAALRLKPDYAEGHNNLGAALLQAGRTDEAVEQFSQATRLKPDYADAHNNLGFVLASVGRTSEAIECYRRALQLKPDYVQFRCNLARTLAGIGRTDEAIAHYQQVVQSTPDHLDAILELAWLLATREPAEGGDAARAVQLAQRARELSAAENVKCLDTLAAAYAAAGRCADAIMPAQRAAQLAESAGQTALAREIQARLELYRAGRPYRQPPPPPPRPNVVFILVDDLRWDELGCAGHPFVKTPHVDRIAREGLLCRNAFVVAPLCSPSRASFLTGLYPHAHGIIDNTNRSARSYELVTFPRMLHAAGYETGYIGKWHMGNDYRPRPGFDYWLSIPGQGETIDPDVYEASAAAGGPQKGDIATSTNAKPEAAATAPAQGDAAMPSTTKVQGYVTDIFNQRAVRFLRRPRQQPFLLYLAHKAIHPNVTQRDDGSLTDPTAEVFIPAERHRHLYADEPIVRRPNAADDLAGKPALTRRLEGVSPLAPGSGTRDEVIRNRLRMLMAIDEGVGQIFQALEQTGQLDNTMLIFTSDEGYFNGEHHLSVERRLAYEESIRIPLLIRYPRLIRPGSTLDRMVLNIDVAPTLLELAGAPLPQPIHGCSLVPLLRGDAAPWRSSFLVEYYSDTVFPRVRNMGYTAVRSEQFKYIHYNELADMDELYDLQADPYEMKNLVADPAAQATLRQVQAELEKLRQDSP